MRQKINLEDLLAKYKSGTCSEAELALLENWYLQWKAEAEPLSSKTLEDLKAESWANQPIHQEKIKAISLWPKVAAAAIILCFLSIGILIHLRNEEPNPKVAHNTQIKPGGNKAYLTLADGKRIVLTDAANGEIARQSGIKITKAADGQVIYEIAEAQNLAKSAAIYNTIETPKGGQYQLKLPDGTKVWLNAASSLRFPTSFAALKERKVQLNGEAYFEVAKDKNKAFLVSTEKQVIEVLGTHFNINSYFDNAATTTTLLEGSVKVISAKNIVKILKPGEQSSVTDNIVVSEVNVEDAVAWKNGYFNFDDEKLESIMKEIARWYDVDVVYQNNALKTELFGAVTTRFADVTMLLRMLEETGSVKFVIKGKQIIISKK